MEVTTIIIKIFEISTCMSGTQSLEKSTIQLLFELDLRVILFQISELLIALGLLSVFTVVYNNCVVVIFSAKRRERF